MYIIAGLGNPGDKYARTRHNAGFMAVDALAQKLGVSVNRRGFSGLYAKKVYAGEQLVLLKPQTFMNLSGDSIAAALRYYKCPPQNLIVLYDDIDLGIGHLRVRGSGSAGSHNGMKSIIERTGTNTFCRVRIGISRPPQHMDLADYVLSAFPAQELALIERCCTAAAEAALCIAKSGAEKAMQQYNGLTLEA